MVYHLVLCKLKSNVSEQQIQEFERAWHALQKEIRGLLSIEGGPDMSIENLNKGYTRAYVVKFTNKEARNVYVSHPQHKALIQNTILPLVDDICVVDVEF